MAPKTSGGHHNNRFYISLFTYGLASGLIALAISLFLKLTINGLFIPEIASQGLVSITSGEIESQAVLTLGPLAKYSSFMGAAVANILVYGFISIFLGILLRKIQPQKYAVKIILSVMIPYWILAIIAISFITLSTIPGQPVIIPLMPMTIFILPNIGFGLIFLYIVGKRDVKSDYKDAISKYENPLSEKRSDSEIDYDRRNLIKALAVSAIAIPLIYFGFSRLFGKSEQQLSLQQQIEQGKSLEQQQEQSILQQKLRPVGFENARLTPLIDAEITPTYLFYRIDINAIVPSVDVASWNLKIKGLVDNPLVINYEEIKKMNSIEEFATLACVSNKIGGNLTSTALWKGVRLKDILSKTKVKSNVKYIVFRCYDGYDVGIPIENGMMDGTILAYEMNKQPLTNEHGFPVRAVVPGFYGMMNPKWITEIELVDQTYEGFWQRKGWTNNGIKEIYSSIVVPGNQAITERFPHIVKDNTFGQGKNVPIGGIAFAGDRGISKVEVSTDGGNTWKSTIVKDPLSKYTWVLWTAGFVPKDNGNYKIVVRATDKTGQIQTSEFADPFPNGAGGYDRVELKV